MFIKVYATIYLGLVIKLLLMDVVTINFVLRDIMSSVSDVFMKLAGSPNLNIRDSYHQMRDLPSNLLH